MGGRVGVPPAGPHLFAERGLADELRSRITDAEERVRTLGTETFEQKTNQILFDEVIAEFGIACPRLERDKITIDPTSAERPITDFGRTVRIAGTEYLVFVPFVGDGHVFRWIPSSHDSLLPQGKVEGAELLLRFFLPLDPIGVVTDNSAELGRLIDRELTNIEKWLASSESEIENFTEALKAMLRQKLVGRRAAIASGDETVAALGYPRRERAIAPNPDDSHASKEAFPTRLPPSRETAEASKGVDFFISHASPDKAMAARPIAQGLTARGYSVWLDEAELVVGDSLARKIDEALAACRFGVVILSHAFFSREWPRRELDGLTSRQILGSNVILPVWHGVSQEDVAGYSPTLSGFLATKTQSGIAQVVDDLVEAYERRKV